MAGGVEQVAPSRCSRSKKYGVTCDAGAHRPCGTRSPGTAAAGPSVVRASASPSSTKRRRRQRAGDLDDLGQPGGDVVEAAGRDEHLVAVAVHLDPDAVELGVDRDLGRRRPSAIAAVDVGRAGGEHRHDRPADLEPERRRARPRRRSNAAPAAATGRAGEHRGAAYGGERDAGDLRPPPPGSAASRAPWRTLPVTTPRSHACSSAVARPKSAATASRARPGEPAPAMRGDRLERLVDLEHGQGRLVGGGGRSLTPRQPRPVRRWRSAPPR